MVIPNINCSIPYLRYLVGFTLLLMFIHVITIHCVVNTSVPETVPGTKNITVKESTLRGDNTEHL